MVGEGGAGVSFPYGHPACFVCGTCKRERVRLHRDAALLALDDLDLHLRAVLRAGSLASFLRGETRSRRAAPKGDGGDGA